MFDGWQFLLTCHQSLQQPFVLLGLFVAGVFSGALSTVSSGLNSLAAVTLQVIGLLLFAVETSNRVILLLIDTLNFHLKGNFD